MTQPLSDTTIRSLVDNVQAAEQKRAQELERGRAKLYRPDGQPLFSEAEMNEQLFGLEGKVGADFDRVHGPLADRAYNEVRAGEAELETLDALDRNPLAQLDPTEASRAASLLPFIEADVVAYSPAELRPQVSAAIATNDRPMMVVWHRALLARARVVEGEHRLTLIGMADVLLDKLRRPEIAEKRKLAQQRIDQGRKLLAGIRDVTRPLAIEQERQWQAVPGNIERLARRAGQPSMVER